MTNITPVVSSLLTAKSSTSIRKHVHSPERLDTFLQEAYRINTHISSLLLYLRQIRQPYLSTTGPPPSRSRSTARSNGDNSPPVYLSDSQRAEIDTQTSTLLHDLSSNISSLTAAENLRSSTETALLERRFGKRGAGRNNILWRWAAGGEDGEDDGSAKSSEELEAEGRAHTVKVFREGVLWYLGWKLQGAVDVQRGMVEVRAAREREREKSVLWKMKGGTGPTGTAGPDGAAGGIGGQIPRRTADNPHDLAMGRDGLNDDMNPKIHTGSYNATLEGQSGTGNDDNDDDAITADDLPPHLLSLFATENASLLQHYNTTLTKIAQAEKSLLEISSLQSTLLGHLSSQGEMIEQLVQDAQGTGENVRRGNRELKRARERWGRGLARAVFWGTVGLCGFLVGWDLVF